MAKVSVIVVNFNGSGITIDCLKALEEQIFKDFNIIIVDNGSSDNSLSEVQTFVKESILGPQIMLIPLMENRGFAGGNLGGLKFAEGEYIALLNNDTQVERKWLSELTGAMENHSDVGMCASKLIVHGTNIIDSAGDGFSVSLKGFKRGEGENATLFSKKEYVFGACAAAVLLRRTMVDEIGFLDEDFFLIHEDTDLNFRAQLHGWKVLYVPTALVFHKVRSTIGRGSPSAVYYTLRNSELVKIKNVPLVLLLKKLPWLVAGLVSEFFYFAIKRGHYSLYIKAKIDALRMIRVMIEKRRKNLKGAIQDAKSLNGMMSAYPDWNCLRDKLKKLLTQ